MISHSFPSDDNSDDKNFLNKFFKHFIKRVSLLAYHGGEKISLNLLFTILCLFFTYMKFLGIICFFYNLLGIASNPLNHLIEIFNQTELILKNEIAFKFFLIFFFCYNIIYLGVFFILYKLIDKNNHKFTIFLIRFYQISNIINFWVIFMTEFELSFMCLLNIKYKENFIFKGISIINLMITILICILYCMCGNKVEFNFEKSDYLSRLDTLYEIFFFIGKIIFSVNYIIFKKLGVDKFKIDIYISICCANSLSILYLFQTLSFYYHSIINVLFLYFNLSTFLTTVLTFIASHKLSYFGTDFLILSSYIILYPASKYIVIHRVSELLLKIPFVEIKNEKTLCKYLIHLIYLVCTEKLEVEKKLVLIGMIKKHEQNCIYDDCVCKQESGTILFIPKTETQYITKEKNNESSNVYLKHVIIKIFEFLIKVTREKNVNLITLFSYYMFYYIGNYHASLCSLLDLKKNKKLNFQQKSSVKRIFEMINHKIDAINSSKIKRIDIKGNETEFQINFKNLIRFYEKVTKLKNSINSALEYSTQFWTCIQNRAQIRLIKKNGLDFFKYHNDIENTYKVITNIYENLKDVNIYYIKYKEAVFNEQKILLDNLKKEQKSYEKIKQSLKLNEEQLEENEKYYNSKCVVVIANLTDKNKAIIEKVSENVKNLLGYSPSECLGQDVKLLMPNIYKDEHHNFIKKHFDNGKNIALNHERQKYALHANYYSIPVMLSVKMLSNYKINKTYYVAVMREIPIDHDFILTSETGKIEILSKGIFSILFNNYSVSLLTSIDFYIHFICKEYFEESAKIFNTDYKLTNFLFSKKKLRDYKYVLMHFKNDSNIEIILKEFKKNENLQSNTGERRNIEATVMKIYNMKDKILLNFKKDCIKRYVKIEEYTIYTDKNLIMFKLFQNINADGNVNLDEIKIIDKYINSSKNETENDKYKRVRLLYGTPFNLKINSYNDEDIIKNKRKSQKFLQTRNSLIFEHDKKIDQELFREYVTIKKNYLKKKASTQMKVNISFSFNLIVFILTIILSIENLLENERGVLHIFKSIRKDYYSLLPLYNEFGIIDKCLKLIAIKDTLLLTETGNELFNKCNNDLKSAVDRLDAVLDYTITASYDFSNSFLDYFNSTIIFNDTTNKNEIMSLENFIWRLSTIIHYIYLDINLINTSNYRIQILFKNLSSSFFNLMGEVFNKCLVTSLEMINSLIKKKEIIIYLEISIVVIFGGYIYIKLIGYYCVQSSMIGMLLSIDQDECEFILKSIRELKISAQKKLADSYYQLEESEENENEKARLINNSNNEIDTKKKKNKSNEISKNKKNPLTTRKKKSNSKKYKFENERNISVYVFLRLFLQIFIIICLDLTTFLYQLLYKFYDNKCEEIISLMRNINLNYLYFLECFLYVQHIIIFPETIGEDGLIIAKNILQTVKQNQLDSSVYFYKTLNGFNNQEQFMEFYCENFCIFSDAPSTYCYNESAFINQSFLYVMNMEYVTMDQVLINNELTLNSSNINLLNDSKILLAHDTFDSLSSYGFSKLNYLMCEFIESFIQKYSKSQDIIFIFNIFTKIICQILLFIYMKRIIEEVDIELKNIFSLMPFPLAVEDKNIQQFLA